MILLFWYILFRIEPEWWVWGFFGVWAIFRVFWISLKLIRFAHENTKE